MINLELFHFLKEVPHIAGQIQKIPRAAVSPAAPCCVYLHKGFAYEFYHTDKDRELVSWFWLEGALVIPTSPYSKVAFSEDAVFYEFGYSRTFRSLRKYDQNRAEYALIRGKHNLQIAERMSDIQYLSPYKNYLKLRQQLPKVFDYASEVTIASFLNIEVRELRKFMQVRSEPLQTGQKYTDLADRMR